MTAAALALVAPLRAQTTTQTQVMVERNVDIQMVGGPGAPIEFMAAPIAFDTDTVTGAPYSAEAVTEVVQSLADGNRIVRESRAELARDSAGRTRREQGLAILGPMVNAPDVRQVQITDPATRTITLLDTKNKRAHRMPMPNIRIATKMIGEAGATFEMAVPPPSGESGGVRMFYSTRAGPMEKPATESLGTQTIEGVVVDGTRTTFTIPAGQIGNELPISIVSERWFSPELKVLVMSRQTDPRFGETTYRLTNISRAEPSPSLFEVPADFVIDEGVKR
jgi:hypothetical protein